MCTYNGSRYLSEQLCSIGAQSKAPGELVVCDDNSSDETAELVAQFAQGVSFPVRFFKNDQQLGPARNFDKAIRLCEGEIVFLADQDDIWFPQKIEKTQQLFEQHPEATYVFSDAEMVDEHGVKLNERLWDAVGLTTRLAKFSGRGQLEILLKHNIITGAAMAFRASLGKLALPIPTGWMHDYWLVLLGSLIGEGIPVQEPLLLYRRHSAQVCGWRKKTMFQVFRDSLDTGGEEWSRKLSQFASLMERVQGAQSEVSELREDKIALLKEKEQHLLTRAKTRSSSGIVRVARVLAEASTGRYRRFSNSWYSIVRDL